MNADSGAVADTSGLALRQALEAAGVRFLMASYVDMHGVSKAKLVPIDHFDQMMAGSEMFTGAALEGVPQSVHDNEVAAHPDAVGEVINVGSGFEIAIGDTARLIAGIMGRDVEIVSEAERLRPPGSEVERLYAGIDKAARLIGWRPQDPGLDGFRRGLERTIDWFSAPENRARYRGGYQV